LAAYKQHWQSDNVATGQHCPYWSLGSAENTALIFT